MKKSIALICAVAVIFSMTACSEWGAGSNETQSTIDNSESTLDTQETESITDTDDSSVQDDTATNDEPSEISLDIEFLSEFGMTLSELEEKHGIPIEGEVEDYDTEINVTYRFKKSDRGYSFRVYDREQVTNPKWRLSNKGKTVRLEDKDQKGKRIEFDCHIGEASDLFLGMESAISIDEIDEIIGIDVSVDDSSDTKINTSINSVGGYTTYFWHGEQYFFTIQHEIEDVIDSDSLLSVQYFPQGSWF